MGDQHSSAVVTHVIFDMDGLLLDTEGFYTEVQEEIAREFGKEFTWKTKAAMMGQKAIAAARVFIDDLDLWGQMTPEEFLKKREIMLDRLFPESQLLPGARELLQQLALRGVPMSLATSSHKRHYLLKTSNHKEIFDIFDHVTTGDEVAEGKPSPEIFLKSASKWTPQPHSQSVLVFEDSPSGLMAAKAAHMKCVVVPHPNLDRKLCKEADDVLDSLEYFRPEQYGMPGALL